MQKLIFNWENHRKWENRWPVELSTNCKDLTNENGVLPNRFFAWFLDIYQSRLKIHAHFSGLKYLMYYYPVFSSFLGASLIGIVLSSVMAVAWFVFAQSSGWNLSGKSSTNNCLVWLIPRQYLGYFLAQIQSMLGRWFQY